MNAQSIPAVVIASITFYVSLYHLLIYLRRKQHREDLTFALLCLATACYSVFCAGLYSASSVAEGAQWQRLQLIALAFFTVTFLWFVADYTGQKPGIVTYAFSAYYLLVVIVQIVDRSSLTWLANQPAIKTFTLPLLGTQIIYYETTLGPFTAFQGLVGLVASTYILWISIRYYLQGPRRKTVPLLLALGCIYVAAFNDTLVSQGAYQFIYVIEYSYLTMILLMAYSLSSTVVEAAVAKEALRESEARWQFALEGAGDGGWDWNTQTNQVYFSRQWKAMLGFEEHKIGDTLDKWDTLIHPDDRDYVYEEIHKHLEGKSPIYTSEHRVQCKDGTYKWVLDRGQVIEWTKDGKPLRVIGTYSDITRRRQAEEALRESEKMYRSVIENIQDVFYRSDTQGRLLMGSPSGTKLFGYDAVGEMIGLPLDSFWSNPQEREQLLAQIRATGSVKDFEAVLKKKDGTTLDVAFTTHFYYDDHGKPLGTEGIIRDIIERKRAESEREALIAELEAKNSELERFTYTVSHDLKSPLITIGGFVGFLERDALAGDTERVKADVVHINDALTRMQLLLDELLELSRIGRVIHPPEVISFETIAREAVEAVCGRIDARGIQVEIVPGLPTVYGDRGRLVEVMQNLLDNACKFTSEQTQPRIEIGVRQTETGPVFYVHDNGIGIETQYQDQVFGLFNKLDPQSEGTGVGLALVKRIIETHGGKIWVESKGSGQGTTFCFTLNVEMPV
jgi:PAS domain S-box-containing protein